MTYSVDIVSRLWKACDVLRDDGISYQNYVQELTYILFPKMLAERGQEHRLPERFRWKNISGFVGNELYTEYQQMLKILGRGNNRNDKSLKVDRRIKLIYSKAQTSIKKPKHLQIIFEIIDKLKWYSVEKDHLGDLYEGLLEKNAGEIKSGAGQYFTPRSLINCIIRLVKPKLSELIQDPAAGTGGFLIAADSYIKQNNNMSSLSENQKKFQVEEALYGMEIVHETHRLALMNLLLHNIIGDLKCNNTLAKPGRLLRPADVIITNPPFGISKTSGEILRKDFSFQTCNKQLGFLQHIYKNLKKGGRAAVILPDNILFEEGKGTLIRQELLATCNLHTILRLPNGIFYAGGIKTNVLFFNKGKETKNVWIFDMRTNVKPFRKTRPITEANFKYFEKVFGKKYDGGSKRIDEGKNGRFRSFSINYIKNRNFNLDISWLKNNHDSPMDYFPEPEVLITEINSELLIVIKSLDEIMNEITGRNNGDKH